MKIIHCADLHLDSPMETHMTREQALIRNGEILKTFQRMADYAVQEGVRLILIAGDFFDGERVTGRTIETVLDTMRRTPQVDYLYISGNHDNSALAFADRDLPENFKRFSDEWHTYFYDDVAVSGIETTPRNMTSLYNQIPDPKKRVHIVMMHGQTGSVCGVDCVNLNLLKDRGISYLALGHIHSYSCQRLDSTGIYCYPGCLEGRGFDECGDKGFVILDTQERKIRPEFVPFASRKLYRVPVDITGLENNSAVYQAMRQAAQGIGRENMVEFVLTGSCLPQAQIAGKYLYSRAADDFFFTKIKDETRLAVDPEDYAKDVSLKGEFIRLVLASDLREEEKAKIIRAGLEALTGEEITV